MPNFFSGCTGFDIHFNSNVIKELVHDFKSCVLSSYDELGKFGALNKFYIELLSDIALSNSYTSLVLSKLTVCPIT